MGLVRQTMKEKLEWKLKKRNDLNKNVTEEVYWSNREEFGLMAFGTEN